VLRKSYENWRERIAIGIDSVLQHAGGVDERRVELDVPG